MTIAELLKKVAPLPDGEALLEINEVWNNAACVGYARAAAEEVGLTSEQIQALTDAMGAAFDFMSIEEAEEKAGEVFRA